LDGGAGWSTKGLRCRRLGFGWRGR
jgi:hypothetical protein